MTRSRTGRSYEIRAPRGRVFRAVFFVGVVNVVDVRSRSTFDRWSLLIVTVDGTDDPPTPLLALFSTHSRIDALTERNRKES
jgi:hypothetical protein